MSIYTHMYPKKELEEESTQKLLKEPLWFMIYQDEQNHKHIKLKRPQEYDIPSRTSANTNVINAEQTY